LKLPGLDGLDLVRQLHQAKPKLPIILVTAHGTTEIAIEATKWGAFDYVPKPFEVEELLDLTAKALESSRLMSEPVEMGDTASMRTAIVGKSRAMQAIYKEIGRIAATPVTVLIRGDTGTGKELIARALTSHRGGQAWVMRRRTQQEMDQLVAAAGFVKCEQRVDEWGIFTVSIARRSAA